MKDLFQRHMIAFLTIQWCLNLQNNQCPVQFHLNLGHRLSTSCKRDEVLFASSTETIIYHLNGNHCEYSDKHYTKNRSLRSGHCMYDHEFLFLLILETTLFEMM